MATFQSGPFTLYDTAIQEFLNGTQDWDSDSHYCVLLDSGYTPSGTHDTYSDISASVIVDAGYSPQLMSGETVTIVSGETKCDAADVSFGSDVSLTARYCAVVVGTGSPPSGADRLVGYMLLNKSDIDVSSVGGAYTVKWNATNGLWITRNNSAVLIALSLGEVYAENVQKYPSEEAQGNRTSVADLGVVGAPVAVVTEDIQRLIDLAYEADTGLDEADGGSVDQWDPTSWSNYDWPLEQTTATYRPIYRATAATSGNKSVEFSGDGTTTVANQDYMDATFDASQGQPGTIIVVAEIKTVHTNGVIFDGPNGTGRNHLYWLGGAWTLYAGINRSATTPSPATGLKMYTIVFNDNTSSSDDCSLTIDGTKYTEATPGTAGMNDIRVGANVNGQYGGDFYCHAFYIAFRKLSDAEIASCRTYIQTKWGTS